MFSFKERPSAILEMTDVIYDVVIIGGGITGCGIALDASSRGLKVLLLEKSDYASGTSSRSTKLIHGGLRYLKNFEFKLVYDVGREREILHQNAMHLVLAEKMLLPILKKGSLGKFTTSIGLRLYDLLAGVKYNERRIMLNKEETLQEEVLLKNEPVIGGGLYYEYRTDDARLTIDVLKTACIKYGAKALNYARVDHFTYSPEKKVNGLVFIDEKTKNAHSIRAKSIVNAAGPWVDALRSSDQSLYGKRIQHSKGVHLVFAHANIPLKHAIYFDLPDGRMMFAIPRNECTYVGTTDTFYKESLEHPVITRDDIEYILTGINQILEKGHVQKEMILSMWSGVRPLIYEEGKNASELSRHDEIMVSPSGLISIAGGKLTGYRSMAEDVVNLVMKKLDLKTIECSTKTIRLFGGDFNAKMDVQRALEEFCEKAKLMNILPSKIVPLFHKYGTELNAILGIFDSFNNKYRFPLTAAELIYCIQFEQCQSLCDFYVRRTGYLYFEKSLIQTDQIVESSLILQEFLLLSDAEIELQQKELDTELKQTDWKSYY